MGVVYTNLSVTDNFIRVQEYIPYAKSAVVLCESAMLDSKPSVGDRTETGKAVNSSNDTVNKICKRIERLKRMKLISQNITKITSDLKSSITYCANNINYQAGAFLTQQLQLLILEVKKLSLIVAKEAAKETKKILIEAMGGKGSVTSALLAIPIQTALVLYQAISKIICVVLNVISKILNLIPSILAVDPQSMVIFMTPKSWKNTSMKTVNANKSIGDRVPLAIKKAIQIEEDVLQTLNIPIKIASITAGAIAGKAALSKDEFVLPENVCKAMKYINVANIMTSINKILLLIPLAYPLPKYEELKITNIGFLVWLITGFVPAGSKSFGLPV